MNFDYFLHDLREASFYKGQIAHIQNIPGRSAHFGALEKPLAPELDTALNNLGIGRLYTHQAEAVNAARDGENVTVVTATASGKTLCYNLPVLDAVLRDPRARAFYLFPTKALAQDQLGKLNDFGLFPTVRFATYDGDTPSTERRFIKRGAHIVLTNPDMLHVGILPYHATWSAFFAHLKYVVVDEMHTYRGVFGAHVAQIMRRLRRICRFYGSDPQFLCCSATIANPEELTLRLTGAERTVVVDNNGAPSGPRTFVFWNPPVVDAEAGQRRSAHVEATSLFTNLVASGVRNITFTKARKSAELILRYSLNEFAQNSRPDLAEKIMSYRSGYTPQERRKIEQGLFTGKLVGVTATNALELGVDVGGLDATVLTGYPGTIASAWQQAGRAGRGGEESLSVLVALDNPLDQFLMRHPDYFFGRPHERAIVDTDNLRILGQHLLCAAYEKSFTNDDLPDFGSNALIALQTLEEEGKLQRRGNQWRYVHADYPAAAVNIRSASEGAYRILDSERGDRLIGTVESGIAFKNLHEGAIYLHLGETYLVEHLDIEAKTAYVRAVEANYYTEAREYSGILILNTRAQRKMGRTEAFFGEVVVTNRVVGYRRKKLFSDDVLEVVELDLPEQTFETEAFWFTVPGAEMVDLVQEGGDLGGSIHAIEHAAIGMMPLLATCDRWDLGGVSHPEHPDTALPTVFVYDAYPGGVGIAENTFPRMEELLQATHDIIADCSCMDGCPSCIQSPKCGNNNEPLDKRGAQRLLQLLLASNTEAPLPPVFVAPK